MATTETRLHRGSRRGRELQHAAVAELRERRIQAGISQAELARELGCGQAEVSRLESEKADATLPTLGDLRSWDVLIRLGTAYRVGVEAETRVRDQQELVRRIRQRELHGGVDAILIVLSDSTHNRRLAGGLRKALGQDYAAATGHTLAALRSGQRLPGSGLVLL